MSVICIIIYILNSNQQVTHEMIITLQADFFFLRSIR